MPYRRRPHLVSKGERAFWVPLYKAVQGKYRVFCKVRLQDVVAAPDDLPDEHHWFTKIRGYHVDFVICDPQTTAPLLVIELDDRRHRERPRHARRRVQGRCAAGRGHAGAARAGAESV